jgi:outer membrane cobalamin receptor
MSHYTWHPVRLVAACSLIALSACGTTQARQSRHAYSPPGEKLILADEIARSGARNAWEVIKRTPTFLSTMESGTGTPTRMWRRGRGSVMLRETPLVVVDGVISSDLGMLLAIPAEQIAYIRILTGSASTARFGTQGGSGAVMVQTLLGGMTPVARQ